MKGVTTEVIAEVRTQASILEIVSETVVLKRAGNQYKGLCPFHNEKGPSFYVTPDRGIFKCFGCGEGGDVFAFVQKVKGIEFIECVRLLAHRYCVRLAESAEDRQEYDRRSQILLLYQQASEYYIKLLHDSPEGLVARKYLQERGLSPETIEKFKLGFAPNSWDGLLSYLTDKAKATPATLEEAGLVRRRQESTGHYDFFRNRLMVPICDPEGRVIAFGGRTLGDDQAKYINSPDSPIYTKNNVLFGFNLAKQAIKAKDSVIVVEGYFDVITCHQYGFNNAVASCGTALGEAQAKLLVRYTDSKRVFLSFDADAAGQNAAMRGMEVLNKIAEGIGISMRVIQIPGGKDPDECLRSGEAGVAAFQKAIEDAPLMIDFQLRRAVAGINLQSHTGRIEAASRIVPVLANVKSAIARTEYVRQWALELNHREENILAAITEYRTENRMDAPVFGNSGYGQRPGGFQNRGYQNQGGYQNRNNYQNQNQNQGQGQGQGNFGGGGGGGGYQSGGGGQRFSARKFDDGMPEDDSDDVEPGEGAPMRVSSPGSPTEGGTSGGGNSNSWRNQSNNAGGGGNSWRNQGNGLPGGGGGGGRGFQNGPPGQGGAPGGFPAKAQFTKNTGKKFGGKGNFKDKKPEFADEEGLPMPASAMASMSNRLAPGSGSEDAERRQLALYLTSRDDYEKAVVVLADDKMLSDCHQRIKMAIEGIGPNFATIEDLQGQLQDRLAPDSEAARALVDIILKAEEMRKQNASVEVVLMDSRARLLKERLTLLKTEFSGLMSRADSEGDDSKAMAMQSRIMELNQLDTVVLSKVESLEDIGKVKTALDAIESAHYQTTKMETRV